MPAGTGHHDPVARALEAERDGIDRIGIALSVPLGIELLPSAEAQPDVPRRGATSSRTAPTPARTSSCTATTTSRSG